MINWREIPFVRLLIPVIIGILSAIYINLPLPFLDGVLPSLVFILIIGFYRKVNRQFRWIFGLLINLFFIVLAYQFTFYHNDAQQTNFLGTYLSDKPIFMTGTVIKMPDKSREKWIKIELRTQKIGTQKDSLINSKGQVLVYIENEARSKKISYGDLLLLQAQLSSIEAPKNPKSFDYQAYLKFQNIHFQTFIKKEQWAVLAQNQGNPILQLAFKLRLKFLKTLKKHLPSTPEFAVASALILGYKDDLPDELKNAYAGTGAMHVLAVSGLHVGLVYLLVMLLFKVIKSNHHIWRSTKILVLLLVIWSFAILTGASASVMRAATMFTFLAIGRDLQRHINIYNTLAASAFCLLLYDPYLLKNVGFQLSYLAVLGIIYFQPKIYRLWMINHKVGDYLWTLVSVSIAATISTLPISVYYFHQFPVYFWLSGLVVVPAATIILSGGILLFWLDWLIPLVSPIVGKILYGFISGVNSIIFFIQQLPSGLITGLWISAFGLIVLYLMLGGMIAAMNTKKIKWLLRAAGMLMLLSISFAFSSVQQYYKKEIVIYHVYKKTLIDCIDGTTVFSIKSDSMDAKTLKFTNQNYHWSQRIQQVKSFNLSDSFHLFHTWMYQNQIIGFYDKKIAILNKNIIKKSPHKIKVNYLLLQGNASIYIENLLDNYDFELLIFDGSNSTWKIKKWKEKCLELGIDYYDINEEGAFMVSVSSS